MPHDRKLVIGAVALVMGKLRKEGPALDATRDEIEQVLIESGFLEESPFKFITLIIRYGLVNKIKPQYQRINKKYGDLPLAIELDMALLQAADDYTLKQIFSLATVEALIDAGNKYKLPVVKLAKKKEEIMKATGLHLRDESQGRGK